MKLLQRVWHDVKRGENIDLYLTAGVAIILVLLNILGIAPPSFIGSMTLAVLALMAITLLANRYKTEEMLEKAILGQKEVFLQDFPSEWTQQIENSSELWIIGINLARTITSYFGLFEKKIKRGNKINVLLVDPNGMAVKQTAMRRPESGYIDQNLAFISASLKGLCELKKIAPNNIEIKTIDYPLSFGVFAVDPYTATGTLYLAYYPYKTNTPGGTVPKIVLQSKDGHWFGHFRMEIQNLWDNAESWNCEAVQPQVTSSQNTI